MLKLFKYLLIIVISPIISKDCSFRITKRGKSNCLKKIQNKISPLKNLLKLIKNFELKIQCSENPNTEEYSFFLYPQFKNIDDFFNIIIKFEVKKKDFKGFNDICLEENFNVKLEEYYHKFPSQTNKKLDENMSRVFIRKNNSEILMSPVDSIEIQNFADIYLNNYFLKNNIRKTDIFDMKFNRIMSTKFFPKFEKWVFNEKFFNYFFEEKKKFFEIVFFKYEKKCRVAFEELGNKQFNSMMDICIKLFIDEKFKSLRRLI